MSGSLRMLEIKVDVYHQNTQTSTGDDRSNRNVFATSENSHFPLDLTLQKRWFFSLFFKICFKFRSMCNILIFIYLFIVVFFVHNESIYRKILLLVPVVGYFSNKIYWKNSVAQNKSNFRIFNHFPIKLVIDSKLLEALPNLN